MSTKRLPIYVVSAHECGFQDRHSYVVAADHSKEAMVALAENHCSARAGKYAVIVEKVGSRDRAGAHPVVVYFPSDNGETELQLGFESYFQRSAYGMILDTMVLSALSVSAEDDNPDLVTISIPDWLRRIVSWEQEVVKDAPRTEVP